MADSKAKVIDYGQSSVCSRVADGMMDQSLEGPKEKYSSSGRKNARWH